LTSSYPIGYTVYKALRYNSSFSSGLEKESIEELEEDNDEVAAAADAELVTTTILFSLSIEKIQFENNNKNIHIFLSLL